MLIEWAVYVKRKNDDLFFDEKPKRKNSDRSVYHWLLMGLIVLALLFVAILMMLVQEKSANQGIYSEVEPAPEVVIVPFNEIEATFTQRTYQGVVRLNIEGIGQAGGADYSDAFYLFAHADGSLYDPPQLEHFDLEIDGQRAIYTLGLLDNPPIFNPEHRYSVDYAIGDEARTIAFRISDSIVDDNTGEFRITIYQLTD